MSALTDEQKAAYLGGGGALCPFCKSPSIEGEEHNSEGDYIAQRIRCLDCEKSWVDIYTLSEVMEE